MIFIHLFALAGFLLFMICHRGAGTSGKMPKYAVFILFVTAFALRLLAAALSRGFDNDTACFAAWADRIFQVHPSGFYSPDQFTDYPPGYMYVLWLIGGIRHLAGIEYYSIPHLVLLRLPSIFCDMCCGLLLYREASRRRCASAGFFLSAAYLFNPAVILNSSVWGQVDSILALLAALMCLYLVRGRMYAAYIVFGLGVLVKPHMLLFAPVLLAGFLDRVLPETRSGRTPGKSAVPCIQEAVHNCLQALTVAMGMVILCLPFGLGNVWEQYFSTVASYPYAAVNACNLWGLLGMNWVSQDTAVLGIPCRMIGGAAIVLTVAAVLALSLRSRRNREKYPFLGAVMIFCIFLFSVRMHERYLYPGLLLLLLAYIFRPSRPIYLCYALFSLLHFYNTADVLFFYDPSAYDRKAPLTLAVSAGMLLCGGLLFHTAYRLCWIGKTSSGQIHGQKTVWGNALDKPDALPENSKPDTAFRKGRVPRPSRPAAPLKKADLLAMSAVTLLYACFALYGLGDRQVPATSYDMVQGQSLEFDFGGTAPVSLSYYIAPWHGRTFTLEGKEDASDDWTLFGEIKLDNVFTWQTLSVDTGMTHLKLTLEDTQASLLEFVFLDREGNPLLPRFASFYEGLFDEGALYPGEGTCRNSMYFDEIYHGRTAYEFLHGLISYENTHPPLGKIFIALGVAFFGMNPFGWRIAGTLFGIAMVPLMYLFARRLSGSTALSSLACVLFAFDFMHFTQTRIATIDVYITFFVLLMYYFMYRYSRLSFYDTELKKTLLPLGACGTAMGLGIACKWTGVYAGCGLAVIFFAVLYRRYQEYVYAGEDPYGETAGISHRQILERFVPCTRRTVLFCLVFFVLVPLAVYLLSYLPFRDYSGRGLIGRALYNQYTMYSYHSGLESTHAFSSPWYEWPLMKRPVWYYSRIIRSGLEDTGLREGISAFGNPAVWWMGIPAFLGMVWLWIKKNDGKASFLVTGYMAQYLPWFFVTRITFIYHYFPCVPFMVLMIVHCLGQYRKKAPRAFTAILILYGAVAVGLFLLFYPVLSGRPVEAAFVDKYLRWFETWVLTAR